MNKSEAYFAVGVLFKAQVFGPYELHTHVHPQVQESQLVGTAADVFSTSTATVQMWRSSLFELEDFH
jgi:hypothetical protein